MTRLAERKLAHWVRNPILKTDLSELRNQSEAIGIFVPMVRNPAERQNEATGIWLVIPTHGDKFILLATQEKKKDEPSTLGWRNRERARGAGSNGGDPWQTQIIMTLAGPLKTEEDNLLSIL